MLALILATGNKHQKFQVQILRRKRFTEEEARKSTLQRDFNKLNSDQLRRLDYTNLGHLHFLSNLITIISLKIKMRL